MGKKNKPIVILSLFALVVTAGVAYLSSGFQKWSMADWQDKVKPILPGTSEPVDDANTDPNVFVNPEGATLTKQLDPNITLKMSFQEGNFNGDAFKVVFPDVATIDLSTGNLEYGFDYCPYFTISREYNQTQATSYFIVKIHKDILLTNGYSGMYFQYIDGIANIDEEHFGYVFDLSLAETNQFYDIESIFYVSETNIYCTPNYIYL